MDSSRNYDEDLSNDVGYSYVPPLLSDNESGTESFLVSKLKSNEDKLAQSNQPSLAWVPTFKESVDKMIERLLNDSMKFCSSGKMITPPIIVISIAKVAFEFINSSKLWFVDKIILNLQLTKFISFPLYDDTLEPILLAFEESPYGRNSWELSHLDFQVEQNPYARNEINFKIFRS